MLNSLIFRRQGLGRAALLATATLLSACETIPDLDPLPRPKPVEIYTAQESLAAPHAGWPSDHWWTAYSDSQLTGLIEEALSGAPSLVEAEARLRKAQAV